MSEPSLRLGVLASGRGSNFAAILDAIDAGDCDAEVAILVSDRPTAQALVRAAAHAIPTAVVRPADYPDRVQYDLQVVERLRAAGVQLVVLAGYMRIVTPTFLACFPGRVINIHPALLPAFPGLHAQRQALAYGVKVTGCTVHVVDEGVDSGPILLQRAVAVEEDDTEESLSARILVEEHKLYPEAIRRIARGEILLDGRPRRAQEVG
ncbi:MAG: phosphoribosylglycinamide formyltransferase [Nitrospirae bacterium CG18_big_fil_WC_8_21_14_2_50_70_55]|nr:phosphoribosylglycinamide formyltransferase [Deltaproteobacteria bacterium]OIP67727.1 MAG: phosphoribosylglycinamide formyltransferase [Nitrospirae bacterium CG2_30_70_394]PIQ03500.1 MAG: phosphoribosylglycinamide formyltransferase [Nitrospirae bacterium CG18_big_fil_WC_8_21_14_2_50_70_55]PIU77551.1 MAG: phosphoribosylglycinamide formyltransferase [Nitrospirae bacterium CG06_land_8_20_14_3_00_70_43]PIW83679.1 MAG: phosphoribosylglycinamide formyltransferase [Nitrospirae bacterium CG_4_8_14_3